MKRYKNVIDIVIDIESGIYQFCPWSGNGKTYLFKLLRELEEDDKPIVTYTYSDHKKGVDLRELIEKTNPEVIMLDRQDMYAEDTKIVDILNEYADKAIILVCNKRRIANVRRRTADIAYTADEIRVTGW